MFTEGMRLKNIFWHPDGEIKLGTGNRDAKDMTVKLVKGQMNYVPWVRVELWNGMVTYYNMAYLEGCRLEIEQEAERRG